MDTETRSRIWLLVQDPADCALLQAAAEQAGLLSCTLSAWPEAQAQPSDELPDLIVVDEEARSLLLKLPPTTEGSSPLCITIEPDGSGARPEACADPACSQMDEKGVLCRLLRPLVIEQVAQQLRLLAEARRAFVAQHLALAEELHRYGESSTLSPAA